MLLSFYRLMQAIAPTTALHDTASLLVYNLDFAILNDILVIEVEHGISLEQLLNGMYALTLGGVVVICLVFQFQAFFICNIAILDVCHNSGHVGQYEQIGIINLRGQPFITLVCQIYAVLLFFHHKIERVGCLGHATVVVLHVDFLGSQHTSLDTRL